MSKNLSKITLPHLKVTPSILKTEMEKIKNPKTQIPNRRYEDISRPREIKQKRAVESSVRFSEFRQRCL